MRQYRLDSNTFKERCIEIHKGKYDYSKAGYVNTRTKVCIICPIHGEFWQTAKNHLKGQGCPICAKEEQKIKAKGNFQNFIQESQRRFGSKHSFPNIESEYENEHSKITIQCNDCGNIFTKRANDHITSPNGGCCNCREIKRNESTSYTYDYLLGHNVLNLQIKPFEGVKSINEKVTIACPIHGEYEINISSFLKGKYACKKCSIVAEVQKKKERFKTEFVSRLNSLCHGNATPLMDTFVDSQTYMAFRCNVCGREYRRQPNIIFTNKLVQPCQHCIKDEIIKQRTKTTETFISDAIKIHGDKYDYSKTQYIQSDKKVDVICKECGRTFSIEANSHLQGHGCPYHYNNKSKYETEIVDFLKECGIDSILTNDRTALNGQELDIYIPSHNIAIEFDGIFWHSELYKQSDYHLLKTKQCEELGIRLIHIFEDEWINKKDIWKSMLKNIFSITENVIYARKCEIRLVDSSVATKFLNENHIQGACGSQIKYGLFYNNELVSLMTFGNSRHFIGNGLSQYELLRFCNKLNTRIIGGASKLFKHFINVYQPQSIVSYADRRWSVGNLYDKLNFHLYNTSKPNYYYVIKGQRANRFNYRKSILVEKYNCPIGMSEQEFCKQQGWHRIYDCGCLCYEWKP